MVTLTANLEWLRTWYPAIAIVLTLGLAAAAYGLRHWAWERFSSARFFTASLIVHLLILLVMGLWSLPVVVEMIVTKMHEDEAGKQPFDDNEHESHEDGRQAWEKLADLRAVEKQVNDARREVEPINLPGDNQRLQPTISAGEAKHRSLNKLLLVAPDEAVEMTAAPARSARPKPAANVPMGLPDDPVLTTPIAKRDDPRAAKELERLTRKRPVATPAPIPKSPPREEPPVRPMRLKVMTPAQPSLDSTTKTPRLPRPSLGKQQLVEISEEGQLLIKPVRDEQLDLTSSTQPELPRESTDRRELPKLKSLASPRRPRLRAAAAPISLDPADTASQLRRPLLVPRSRSSAAASRIPQDEPLGVVLKSSAPIVSPILKRPMPAAAGRSYPLPATRLTRTTGPGRRRKPLRIGRLAERALPAPPAFGPQATALDRPRARAMKVVYAVDNVGLREMFSLRDGDVRRQHIELLGGTPKTESAVRRGLKWLAAHQNPNGSWSLHAFHANCKGKHANCGGAGSVKSDAAATGLAILPFLGAGQTHQKGEFQKQVGAALKWLAETQKAQANLLAKGDQQVLYSHCIATIAVCEAYGMTHDPALKPVAQKAIEFIVKAQHNATGGWRYKPNEAADTSVVGWGMMALKSGEMAGLTVPPKTFANVARWLKKVEGNQPVGGQFGYQNRSVTPAMTAEGMLCLQFLNTPRDHPRLLAGADYLLKNLPEPNQSKTSYYWYYATQAMYHMQGDYWDIWNEKIREQLVKTQITKGPLAGTWNPRDNWERSGGRIYTTSIKLLMLEVYYRHLPLFQHVD